MAKLELKEVINFNFLSKNLSLSKSDQTRMVVWCGVVWWCRNIAFIVSRETTERIPNLFTELVIIIHSYKAHNKLLILKEKNYPEA